MKTYILEVAEDTSFGGFGVLLPGMSRDEDVNPCTDGLLFAHDLIEHVNGPKEIGSIDDELEALGAVWYVRGQTGALRRDGGGSMYTVHQSLASDVTRMFRDYFYGTFVNDFATLRTRAVTDDEDLQDILVESDATYLGEIDEEDKPEARRKWRVYRAVALHRMRMGYSKARRRYEHRGGSYANMLFWVIAHAVGPYIKHCEYPGQRFKLTVDMQNIKAWCEEDYPTED